MIDVEDKTCPCCAGALHKIGEDTAERLDVIPAIFRALVVRRPKYECRACEEVVVQAPAPPRVIEGGMPTEATIAHVIVGKSKSTCLAPSELRIAAAWRRYLPRLGVLSHLILLGPQPSMWVDHFGGVQTKTAPAARVSSPSRLHLTRQLLTSHRASTPFAPEPARDRTF